MMRTAATREEEAELQDLRDRADRTTAEAARTLAELTGRLEQARQPGAMARRLAADARNAAMRALREGPGRLAGQRGARRTVLAAIPVLAIAAALALAAARQNERSNARNLASPPRRRLHPGDIRPPRVTVGRPVLTCVSGA